MSYRRLHIVLALLSAWTLMACASLPPQSPAVPMPPSLLQPCQDLALPNDGSRAAMLRWATDTALAYRECQARHAALARAAAAR